MDLMDGGIAPPTAPQPQQQSKKIQFKGEGAAGEAVCLLPEMGNDVTEPHKKPESDRLLESKPGANPSPRRIAFASQLGSSTDLTPSCSASLTGRAQAHTRALTS